MTSKIPIPYTPKSTGASASAKCSFRKCMWNTSKKIAQIPTNRKVQGTVGILGGLAALYGIFKDGPEKGIRNAKEEMGKNYADLFVRANSSSTYSNLQTKLKKMYTGFVLDNATYPLYTKVKNVAASMVGEVLNHGETIAAATGAIGAPMLFNKVALLSSIPHSPTIGLAVATVCTAALAVKGTAFVLHNILGYGKDGL